MPIPCGCVQNSTPPYSTPVYTSEVDCDNGTPCEDVDKAVCTIYSGPNLPDLAITNGMSLKVALIALNNKLGDADVSAYEVVVSSIQSTTVVQYIDAAGALQSITALPNTTSASFNARIGTPAVISGTGIVQLDL